MIQVPVHFTICPALKFDLLLNLTDLLKVAKLLADTDADTTKFLKFLENLSRLIPTPLRTSIFVRPLYRSLLNLVMAADDKSGTVITGTTGGVKRFCSFPIWACLSGPT